MNEFNLFQAALSCCETNIRGTELVRASVALRTLSGHGVSTTYRVEIQTIIFYIARGPQDDASKGCFPKETTFARIWQWVSLR
jgi:hypothetical protein